MGRPENRLGGSDLLSIDHADAAMIGSVLREHVEPGAVSRSDGWRGYANMALQGFQHDQRLVGNPWRAPLVAPHIHRVYSNLKTWRTGTHHGVEPRYWPTLSTSSCSGSTGATLAWRHSRLYSPSPECPAWKGGNEWRGEPSDPSARAYGRRAEALAAYSAEVASATKAGKEGKRLRRVPLSISRCPARERGELHSTIACFVSSKCFWR